MAPRSTQREAQGYETTGSVGVFERGREYNFAQMVMTQNGDKTTFALADIEASLVSMIN